jgi:hypothetical protein
VCAKRVGRLLASWIRDLRARHQLDGHLACANDASSSGGVTRGAVSETKASIDKTLLRALSFFLDTVTYVTY